MLLTAFCRKAFLRSETTSGYHSQIIQQTVRIMKLMAILLFVFSLTLSAKTLSQTVSFSGKNVPLEKILLAVKEQTGFFIVSNQDEIRHSAPVTVDLMNADLSFFLERILMDQPFEFLIEGKTIAIRKKITTPALPSTQRLSASLFSPPITGRITDPEGHPVSGISITIKGTKTGTTTDANGYFSLNGEIGQTLLISSVEFETQEIKIDSPSEIHIHLTRSVAALHEVVINKGYYSETKKLSTGTVSKIDAKTIHAQPISNPLLALQGRVAGMLITPQTGLAGGAVSIQIRGNSNLNPYLNNDPSKTNAPLYVIDGVPYDATAYTLLSNIGGGATLRGGNPLSNINPQDIESIEVLKDADATSIYGSRGSNGVILIATKKGKPGKTSVDINLYQGWGQVSHFMKLLNTSQYLEMRKEGLANEGMLPQSYHYDLLNYDSTRYTDWQKELIGGTAQTQNAQVSLSGGNEFTQFLFSGGWHRETTVYPGDFSYKKASGLFNLLHKSTDQKFRLNLSANYVYENNNQIIEDLTSRAVQSAPNAPAGYDENGKLNWGPGFFDNPYALVERTYVAKTNGFRANTQFNYRLVPSLELKLNAGFTRMQTTDISTLPSAAVNAFYGYSPGNAYFGSSNVSNWIIEPQAEYKKDIGASKLGVLIGSTFQKNMRDFQLIAGSGYRSDDLLMSIKAAGSTTVSEAQLSDYRYAALFGRINYNLLDRFIVNLTARRDGSSRFGDGKQFGNFGAVGAAWIFSQENFMKRMSNIVSFGKLRMSYGTTGNDQIGNYGYFDTYGPTSYNYQGNPSLQPGRLANREYGWEINKKLEVSLDLGMLNNKINLTATYYQNRSSNQLIGFPLSIVAGFNTIQGNFPAKSRNTGIELELNAVNIETAHFRWTTAFNLTIPRSKLLEFDKIENNSTIYLNYELGQPLTIKKTYDLKNIDPQTGLPVFTDYNNDGRISSPGDLKIIVNDGQDYYGGIQNSFTYNNWQLDFFFQFVKQQGVNYITNFSMPGLFSNQPVEVLDRWRQPGDISSYQKFSAIAADGYTAYGYYQQSQAAVTNASFVRLKNLSLSYMLPDALIKKAKLKNARIYFQGQNLFTITPYKGLDPETQSVLVLPSLRVLTLGCQFTF